MEWRLTKQETDDFGLTATRINWHTVGALLGSAAIVIGGVVAHVRGTDAIRHNHELQQQWNVASMHRLERCEEEVRDIKTKLDDPEGILKGAERRVSRIEAILEEVREDQRELLRRVE